MVGIRFLKILIIIKILIINKLIEKLNLHDVLFLDVRGVLVPLNSS